MKVLALLLILTAGAAENSGNATDSHRQAAEELLVMSRAEQTMEPMFKQIRGMFEKQIVATDVPPEKQAIVQSYMSRVLDLTERELRWDLMREDVIGIYTEVFTESEIRELISFYKTPIGQKSLERIPLVLQRSIVLSQERVKKIMPQVQALNQQMAEELKAKQ